MNPKSCNRDTRFLVIHLLKTKLNEDYSSGKSRKYTDVYMMGVKFMFPQIYKGLQHFATLWTYIFAPFRLLPFNKLGKFKECLKALFLAVSLDIYLLIIIILIIIINFIQVSDSLAI